MVIRYGRWSDGKNGEAQKPDFSLSSAVRVGFRFDGFLYDRNGLLKPEHVGANGYRYYSIDQVPRLRLICLLKEMGVPLARIGKYLEECSVDGMHELLVERMSQIDAEIDRLRLQQE